MVPRKGQITTLDLSTAFIIILSITIFTQTHHHQITSHSIRNQKKINTQKKLYTATESLITTPGKPRGWEKQPHKSQILGLAEYKENTAKHHEINREKLEEMKKLPLETIKGKLGLEDLQISVEIQKLDGENLMKKTDLEKKNPIQVKRIALMEGEILVFKLQAK